MPNVCLLISGELLGFLLYYHRFDLMEYYDTIIKDIESKKYDLDSLILAFHGFVKGGYINSEPNIITTELHTTVLLKPHIACVR